MLVHRRVTPSIKFAGTHLYTWVERGTVRVKYLAQEHNTMSPARPRTRSARPGVERTNHEATAPPLLECSVSKGPTAGAFAVPLRVLPKICRCRLMCCLEFVPPREEKHFKSRPQNRVLAVPLRDSFHNFRQALPSILYEIPPGKGEGSLFARCCRLETLLLYMYLPPYA